MYLGLVGPDGAEIRKRGYCRVCIDHVRWALLPGERTGMWFVFINLDEIHFRTALESWGGVIPVLFKEPETAAPMHVLQSNPVIVAAGQHAVFHRGALQFDSHPS